MSHVALYIVFAAIALASYSCAAKCTELFQRRAASAKPRCKCVVAGQCPNSDYLHQGGGGDGCNLYNNYLTCLKNAQKNFDTVVLNSGELLRRVRAGAGRRDRNNTCLNSPSDEKLPGFACPDGTAPRNPSDTEDGVLCVAEHTGA